MKRRLYNYSALLLSVILFNWLSSALASAETLPQPWPPAVGKPYPALELKDYRGTTVRLSDFKGRVLLIEPIGMSCPACQAFCGGNKRGGFGGVSPQANLLSIPEMLQRYASVKSLDSSRLMLIQILFYDMRLGPPNQADAQAWVKHFGLESPRNHIVLVAPAAFQNDATYNLIPGFQLVDKDFNLRYDSTGHRPRNDLYRELLPAIPQLLNN